MEKSRKKRVSGEWVGEASQSVWGRQTETQKFKNTETEYSTEIGAAQS
jgi:hypothetical protein